MRRQCVPQVKNFGGDHQRAASASPQAERLYAVRRAQEVHPSIKVIDLLVAIKDKYNIVNNPTAFLKLVELAESTLPTGETP